MNDLCQEGICVNYKRLQDGVREMCTGYETQPMLRQQYAILFNKGTF